MNVELNRDLLVDLGGWAVLKEARGIVDAGRVKSYRWENRVLTGEIAGATQAYFPRLNLRSITFAENRCGCPQGRRGNVCAHAIALCLASMEQVAVAEDAATDAISGIDGAGSKKTSEALIPVVENVKSLVLSEQRGVPARFRILLPPNLATSAPKDRIAVRVEFELASGKTVLLQEIDRGFAYQLALGDQLLGGFIELLCGGKLHSMLQLTRKQLRDMLKLVEGVGWVSWVKSPGTAMEWHEGNLDGVHQYLQEVRTEVASAKHEVAVVPQGSEGGMKPSRETVSEPQTPESLLTSRRVKVDGSPHFLAIELPSREDPSYFEIFELLKQWRFKLEPGNGKWWLRDSHHVMNFLADYWELFRSRYEAEFSKNFSQRMAHLETLHVGVSVTQLDDGYELNLGVTGDVQVSEVRTQLAKGRRFIQDGERTLLINQNQLQTLETLTEKLIGHKQPAGAGVGMRMKVASVDYCDWETLLDESGVQWVAPDEWKRRSGAIRNLSKLVEAPVEAALYQRLRLYQKIGVAWMYHLFSNRLSGLLADEMGLGKTVQAIALMTAVQPREQKPVLVVCPAGLVGNWMRELHQFAPGLNAYSHHGSSRMQSSGNWDQLHVVVSSYSTVARDLELFHAVEWSLILGDEAQHIKNRRTQHAKSLKQLRATGKFLLTGTPVENSIEDLYSLFEFLMPGYLKKNPSAMTRPEEKQWYQDRIRERASHYILRRTKAQVAPELPEKLEQVIYCDMDDPQRELYDRYRRNSALAIEKLEHQRVSEGALKMAAFTELLRLRQICADPRLLESEREASISCKLGVFRELLEESIDGGHRMLVFSQFVSVLQLLKMELEQQGLSYCYLDGSTRNRLAEVDRFNQQEEIPVFLISLKAGGTGLNLTGADTVVHFDPWWNPAVEAQATDRAHRIGQTRKVTSIRLIVSGTVEEKVQVMQQKKRKILEALFDESANITSNISLSDVKDLLRAD